MNLRIYQIDMDRDHSRQKFRELDLDAVQDSSIPIDSSIYDEVFHGTVDCESPEDVYYKFNTEGHPLHRGHSLSVSDVVVTDEGAFYCQPIGFQEVSFDESQAHKPSNLLRVVYVEPGKPAYEAELSDDVRSMQRAVKGPFQVCYIDPNALVVYNDDGKLNGMPGNRKLDNGTVFVGPFFVVSEKGEDFVSLSDEQAAKFLEMFAQPQEISQAEIDADSYVMLIGM